MIFAAISLFGILLILFSAEGLRRTKRLKPESSRKLVHILSGVIIATWPYYIDTNIIVALAGLMFLTVLASMRLGIFTAIHSVSRRTIGELFFPIGIAAAALIANETWIFTVAILHMSLADGFAAIVGTSANKSRKYKVFGYVKSYAGTTTFFVASVLIMIFAAIFNPEYFRSDTWLILVWLPVTATVIENVAPYGSDDLFVPVIVAFVLNLLPYVP